MTLPEIMTVSEVAEYLRVGRFVVYAEIRRGRLRAIRVGDHKLRVSRQAVEEYEGRIANV